MPNAHVHLDVKVKDVQADLVKGSQYFFFLQVCLQK